MGINATVVYDVATNSTLVLRTSSTSLKTRYDVIDTVASFAQHCESLRGVATTVTEVSALWGGPPFVTYNVVHSRFRAMIIWSEDPAEFDVAYDVDNALTRLQNAVAKAADGLEHHSEDAIAIVYDAAGYALRADYPVTLQDSSSEQKKSRQKSSQQNSSLSRRSSILDPRRKKSSASTAGGIFGKIGSVLKKASGNNPENPDRSEKLPPSSPTSTSSLIRTSKNGAPFGNEAAIDDALSELQLPDEMFTWTNFGGPLPENDGDLRWFFALTQGERDTQRQTRPPAFREGSVPSTPLTIPSTASPLPETSSGPSSIIESTQSQAAQRQTIALGPTQTPDVSSLAAQLTSSSPNVLTADSKTITPLSHSTPTGGIWNSSQPIPTMTSSDLSSQASALPNLANPISTIQSSPVNVNHLKLGSTQTSLEGIASFEHSPAVVGASNENLTQMQRLSAVSGRANASEAVAPPPSLATSSRMSSGPATPQQIAPNLINAAANQQSLLPGLVALNRNSDFDVSNLGSIKDQNSQTTSSQIGRNGLTNSQTEDDRIRALMNQFAKTMQNGNFSLALQQVQITLKHLSKIQPRRDREITTCSNYVLAQKILMRNNVLEAELARIAGGTQEAVQRHVECALLTMFLAELKHLLPRHRVAAMKIAVEKNSIVGNFGMCARWLRILVEKAPPAQKGEFSNRLQLCIQNGERNSHMPPTNRLCYTSLKVVASPYGECDACGAVYHPQFGGVITGQICPTCIVGRVDLKTQ